MKKLYFFLSFLLIANVISAQLLTEDFNYPAGQLLTNNGWTAHSGVGTNPITVTAPGLTYTGHPGSGVGNAVTMTISGEDDNKTFTSTSNGDIYFSFLTNLSAATATGDYFVGLLQSATIFPYRVYAKSDGATGFFFGVSKANGAIVYEATSRSFGTTYFIVGKYTFNPATTTDDVLNLWVNPALGGAETAATIPNVTGTSTDATSISAVYLRQGGAATSSTQQVDAMLVGTTWAQVTPSGAATPALSATTLTAFGNVCINTLTAANSFTITGSNLTNANVTVSALAGFTYSTTVAGTYTTTLSLAQPGGAYSQQIFVKFNPVAVQSYNGNIPVGGGGATSINVAATGVGVNTVPSVTTGAASAITQTTATLAGSITANGCSAITAYGVEYSLTNGFPNGTGTAVPSTNLAGGNFSSNVTGLTPGLTYYYHAYATNGGGTGYGAQNSFTTIALTPVITVTALTSFGNVCINTVAGPNSFTISGTNLTSANINVGPLNGFSFSTTSGGTYTASLTLVQPGGPVYSQQIFVQFSPVAVQSYNGNIPVTGAGAPATSVAAVGSGVNTAASVTSGAGSAITQTSATLAGAIPSIGCSAVTAYGVEYSITNGFPNGTGTAVPSTNLTGINFSSGLTGLTPSTTYYYHAYATNAGGTSYGTQGSFTTSAPVLTVTPLTAFGANCINTTAGPNSFTINSNAVLAPNITVGPLNGYSFSTTAGGTYTASLSLSHPTGAYTQTVYVRFSPTAVQSYNGNIPVGGGGAVTINVVASGSGVNTAATIATGNATVLSPRSVTLEGSVTNIGCSPVTTYGIEYTGISGLANGLGTQANASNLGAGNFSVTVNGLVPGATYYYKAYATNNGGTSYGPEKSFTTKNIPDGFIIYSSPIKRGGNLHYTYKGIKPGHYEIQLFNSTGQLVYQRPIITQVNYIDDNFIIPGNITTGAYSLHIISPDFRDKKRFMIW